MGSEEKESKEKKIEMLTSLFRQSEVNFFVIFFFFSKSDSESDLSHFLPLISLKEIQAVN
jgi:hypothetical protein